MLLYLLAQLSLVPNVLFLLFGLFLGNFLVVVVDDTLEWFLLKCLLYFLDEALSLGKVFHSKLLDFIYQSTKWLDLLGLQYFPCLR